MADNIAVTPGSGATVGADEISSVKYQRIKLIHGVEGVNDGDIADSNGLPASDCRIRAQEDLVTIGYATVNSSFASDYADAGLANIATSTTVWIFNETDVAMLFNWNGAGQPADMIVPSNCARIIPILHGATDLYMKRNAAAASGSVYFEVRK